MRALTAARRAPELLALPAALQPQLSDFLASVRRGVLCCLRAWHLCLCSGMRLQCARHSRLHCHKCIAATAPCAMWRTAAQGQARGRCARTETAPGIAFPWRVLQATEPLRKQEAAHLLAHIVASGDGRAAELSAIVAPMLQDPDLLGLQWLQQAGLRQFEPAAATAQELCTAPGAATAAMLLPSGNSSDASAETASTAARATGSLPAGEQAAAVQQRAAALRRAGLLLARKRAVAARTWDAAAGVQALRECAAHTAAAALWQQLLRAGHVQDAAPIGRQAPVCKPCTPLKALCMCFTSPTCSSSDCQRNSP